MTTAGRRELRQNASELVRQAEAGAVITVSVSGRAVAELGPAHRDRWRSWSDVAAVFDGPDDPERADDREGRRPGPERPVHAVRTLLDTSVLLGPAPAPIDGELAISAASVAELHFGVQVARDDDVRAERLRRLGVIERTFEALPVDAATARHNGRLAAAVTAVGRSPRAHVMDLLIAATAAANGARLATRDAGDLVGLEDLVEIVDLA